MLIREVFHLEKRSIFSLVGAGGKSSLFSLLAQEVSKQGKKVILTTTTHMFSSQLAPFFEKGALIESDNEEVMEKKIKEIFRKEKYKEIVLISRRETEQGKEKICGPRPWYLDKWWQEKLVDYILVEADGASKG